MAKLMEVLEFLDHSGNIMVKRVPDSGPTEIKYGFEPARLAEQSGLHAMS